ncbi:uncharacterized protein [Solanum tuberosum]|uniref:uncharacterized protein n=1 Tax=Solanum tuberosum TaxID=4113 RepID=UPI00073A1BA2|nr:PREDICTED: uncharacterized protein LOC107060229 [Solanum tuberosum]
MKGIMQFGKKGKLSPRYVGPYQIIQKIGMVTYELDLPTELEAVHHVFNVSMLWKCNGDPSRIIPIENICIAEDLSYVEVPIAILDRQVRKLRTKDVASGMANTRVNARREEKGNVEQEVPPQVPHQAPIDPPDMTNVEIRSALLALTQAMMVQARIVTNQA